MKCSSCGTGLHIEDEKCPFCGNANPYYKKHREEMGKYKEEFEHTKEKVYKKSHFFTGFTVQITVIAVLVAIESILLFVNSNMWNITSSISDYKAEKNYEEYASRLKEYEEAEKYQELFTFMEQHSLAYVNKYKEYRTVYAMYYNYAMTKQYIVRFMQKEQYSYIQEDEAIRYICDFIAYFYKRAAPDAYADSEAYSGIHAVTIENLKRDMELLLITYGHLTPEEVKTFEQQSGAKQLLMLERGLIGDED